MYISRSHSVKQNISSWHTVSFISQPGPSYLVCSVDITVGDACRRQTYCLTCCSNHQGKKIPFGLHQMMSFCTRLSAFYGIILVAKPKKKTQEYTSPKEASKKELHKYVDPNLYKFLMWLTRAECITTCKRPVWRM